MKMKRLNSNGVVSTFLLAGLALGCGGGATSDDQGSGATTSGGGTGEGASGGTNGEDGGSGSTASGGTTSGGGIDGQGAAPAVIDEDGDGRPDCVPGIYPTSQIPRLKNSQYDKTVRDLLGVTGLSASSGALPSSLLATDQGGALSDLGWSSYKTVAEMIAAQVMSDPALRPAFLACEADAAGCLDSTIVDFGRRAFRRPLTEKEILLFQALNDPALTEGGTPEEIAELLLYGFLVSPMFLTRSELSQSADASGNFTLSSHEIASRLSYTLWGSMPDAELDAAADADLLSTKEQIQAQATRMLQDEKARSMVADFHKEYLHIKVNSRWDTFVKDPARFPEFSEEIRAPLTAEVEMFFDQTVFGEGTFQDLFLSTAGFVNNQTASFYGLEPDTYGSDLSPADLPDRPGFLTRVGWLSAYSAASRTSPIVRGAFIIKDVLGIDPGPPPPGATDEPLPTDPSLDTNRKKVDAQTSGSTCLGCHHGFINPPGFVFEAYDTVGRPQSEEADTGASIETQADVIIDGDVVSIAEPSALMAALASSHDAQYYYAQKWVGYSFDREPNSQDACLVEALTTNIAEGGYRVIDLVADITQTDAFTVRAVNTGVEL